MELLFIFIFIQQTEHIPTEDALHMRLTILIGDIARNETLR
jgi:hypothetical protein